MGGDGVSASFSSTALPALCRRLSGYHIAFPLWRCQGSIFDVSSEARVPHRAGGREVFCGSSAEGIPLRSAALGRTGKGAGGLDAYPCNCISGVEFQVARSASDRNPLEDAVMTPASWSTKLR